MSASCSSHRSPLVAVVVGLAALTIAFVGASGCYDYTLRDGEDGADQTVAEDGDARDASSEAVADSAAVPASRCLAGGYYCGGGKLEGRTDSIYRCTSEGTGALIERCANGCLVSAAADDDKCSSPSPCTVGGAYCGGDKINGDPDVLYRCLAGGKLEVITRCQNACQWNTGADDSCV